MKKPPNIFKQLREMYASIKEQDHVVEAKLQIPHNDFRLGFIIGFQSIAGTTKAIPILPMRPLTIPGMTPFLMGVRVGREVASKRLKRAA